MSKEYSPATSVQSSPTHFPTTEKKHRKRQRTGMFSSLMRTMSPAKTEEKRSVLPVMLAVLLWGGLAYGGYAFANHTLEENQKYIDNRIDQIEKANEQQIKQMEEQLVLVQEEMKTVQDGLSAIKEELELTGETIGGTNETKQALQQRIDQLNKQLVELKASLKRLEDAARAW
jgi:peptidoglycan hydrolase CwlO-like protein